MKTLKKANLKALFTALFVLTVLLSLAASCNLTISGKGSLSISLPGGKEAARSISISPETAKNLIYKLELARQGKTITLYARGNDTIRIELDPGRWNIDIIAHCLRPEALDNQLTEGRPIEELFDGDFSVLAGKGKDFADISAGRHTIKTITLTMILGANSDDSKVWAGTLIGVNTEAHIADDVKYEWYESVDKEKWELCSVNENRPEYFTDINIDEKLFFQCKITYIFENNGNRQERGPIDTEPVAVYPRNATGLNAWIADMEPEEGNSITLPPGDFKMNELVRINGNINLAADSDGTTLLRDRGYTENFFIIGGENRGTLTLSGWLGRLTLDGNKENFRNYNPPPVSLVNVNKGELVMEDNVILQNNLASSGGAVQVGGNGTFTMKGGAITGNEAKENGSGVYVGDNSKFTMSGSARVMMDNEVYLYNDTNGISEQFIYVENSLNGPAPAACIKPSNYDDGWKVLEGEDAVLKEKYTMFQIVANGLDSWGIDERGELFKIIDQLEVWKADSSGDGTLSDAIYTANISSNVEKIIIKLPPGTEIKLDSPLEINRSYNIEGGGVTLKQSDLWPSTDKPLLQISDGTIIDVTISRLRFDGAETDSGGSAISNVGGNLKLESCIFSGNKVNGATGIYGSVIYQSPDGDLRVMGCTFYSNSTERGSSAIFKAGGGPGIPGNLYLYGNIFYGNTGTAGSVLNSDHESRTFNANYNVFDEAFNWFPGEKNEMLEVLSFSPKSFWLFPNIVIPFNVDKPEGYPEKDFYGNDIPASWYPGAVQRQTASGKYLDLVWDKDRGNVTGYNAENGIVTENNLTAEAKSGFEFLEWRCWEEDGQNPVPFTNQVLQINANFSYTKVEAVFCLLVDRSQVNTAPGTLRFALGTAYDKGDLIRIRLPKDSNTIFMNENLSISKGITIDGGGVKLTRSETSTEGLLTITGDVTIQRVHFNNGLSTNRLYGGALTVTDNGSLTLESCIFSGNSKTIGNGGAIFHDSPYDLAVKGCTFYRNSADSGGAIYINSQNSSFTLTGNLFFENGNRSVSGGTPYTEYNAFDLPLGIDGIGWVTHVGYEEKRLAELGIDSCPFDTDSFAPVEKLKGMIPEDFILRGNLPEKDFYGDKKTGEPGAVNCK